MLPGALVPGRRVGAPGPRLVTRRRWSGRPLDAAMRRRRPLGGRPTARHRAATALTSPPPSFASSRAFASSSSSLRAPSPRPPSLASPHSPPPSPPSPSSSPASTPPSRPGQACARSSGHARGGRQQPETTCQVYHSATGAAPRARPAGAGGRHAPTRRRRTPAVEGRSRGSPRRIGPPAPMQWPRYAQSAPSRAHAERATCGRAVAPCRDFPPRARAGPVGTCVEKRTVSFSTT